MNFKTFRGQSFDADRIRGYCLDDGTSVWNSRLSILGENREEIAVVELENAGDYQQFERLLGKEPTPAEDIQTINRRRPTFHKPFWAQPSQIAQDCA